MRNPSALILLLAFSLPLHAQDKLNTLRKEIRRIEAQIEAQTQRQESALERLQTIERELGLRQKLLTGLETKQQRLTRQIRLTNEEIVKTTASFDRRRQAMARRMVNMYKRGRMSNWEALFSLNSFHQMSVWLKYHQRILDHDRRNLQILQAQQDSILIQRERLNRDKADQQITLDEARSETRRIENQKTRQTQLLAQVKQDTKALRNQLDQKLQAFEEIKRMIARQQNRTADRTAAASIGFRKLKGRLDWPVTGSTITRFGNVHDATLGVDYPSYGIDIKADEGAAVRAVAGGTVYIVTWVRSMGNLVLIDHGDRFSTVYGHLDQVLVEQEDQITAGDIIGYLGNTSSLHGPVLHFEIYEKKEYVNPEQWLRKK